MPTPPKDIRSFQALVQVIEALRGPEGCPWDKEQTHESLTRFAIEEAHELAEAIEYGALDEVKGELGDLLLQVVLHSEIAKQNGTFEILDVIEALNEKMVRRHPHVFSDKKVSGLEEVKKSWDEIKKSESKKDKTEEFSFDIPKGLPSLLTSFKIGEKTKKLNFDWKDIKPVVEKVKEELSEFEFAVEKESKQRVQEELGDLLFSLAQVARHLQIDPEQALRLSNKKFESRFRKLMAMVKKNKKTPDDLTTEQMEELWVRVKADEN